MASSTRAEEATSFKRSMHTYDEDKVVVLFWCWSLTVFLEHYAFLLLALSWKEEDGAHRFLRSPADGILPMETFYLASVMVALGPVKKNLTGKKKY